MLLSELVLVVLRRDFLAMMGIATEVLVVMLDLSSPMWMFNQLLWLLDMMMVMDVFAGKGEVVVVVV